ncbi:MAG: DUF362 domain-containing protein [Bacteroidota bacterium]|nr:DUF362 domain-containing protein [Bacteroidota bacterium]
MSKSYISRRKFIGTASAAAIGTATFGFNVHNYTHSTEKRANIVSITRIKEGNTAGAVEEAVDLLGGIESVTRGRHKIMLKPNLVADSPVGTTKPEVVRALAQLMLKKGKEVMIGEGSAAADSFNVINNETYRTRKREILDKMQQHVFDTLGYTEMAESLKIPLINLHSGEIVEVPLKNGFAAKSVKIHKSLTEIDLLCSVPMMKTHSLATVTLAMKNLIGLYPGTEYYSVRSWLHDRAAEAGSQGVAFEILDMNNAVSTGLSVIDASTAMEGNGPFDGPLVNMGLIIAGTSPLAADMVSAALMGFDINEIPSIVLAHKTGMLPLSFDDIEIRGLKIDQCKRQFARPSVSKWTDINKFWGLKEL